MTSLAIHIYHKSGEKRKLLIKEQDLSSFSYFTKSAVDQAIAFAADLVVKGTDDNVRSMITTDDSNYNIHIKTQKDLAILFVVSGHYNDRSAQALIDSVHRKFIAAYPPEKWATMEANSQDKEIRQLLEDSKDPVKVDQILQLQNELEEVKGILHNNMQSLLNRGENLDKLVEQSDILSQSSKTFYKTAKKTNSCCFLM